MTGAVTGTDGGNFGPGDTCMWCHRSRVDITNYLTPTGNEITSVYWGPHEGPQADLFTGVGGYQYAGQTYGESTHEQKLSCVDCHMVPVADNSNVPDHSFNPQLSACSACHAAATSFNVNGFESRHSGRADRRSRHGSTAQGLLTRADGRAIRAADGGAARRRQLGRGSARPGRDDRRRRAPHAGPGGRALQLHPRRARRRLRRSQPEVHRAAPLRLVLRAHRARRSRRSRATAAT